MFCVRQGNPTKHMRIQDTFHPDGISYESGDELSETESDLRSSQEKLNGNGTFSPPSKESHGKIGLIDFFSYQFLLKINTQYSIQGTKFQLLIGKKLRSIDLIKKQFKSINPLKSGGNRLYVDIFINSKTRTS